MRFLRERRVFIHFLYNQTFHITKRASSCISAYQLERRKKYSWKGSITIETAMVLPFFFLAFVCILYMMDVMAIRTSVRNGMQYAAKITAEEACFQRMVSEGELEELIVDAIGSERLERSVIVGGSSGIHCNGSKMSLLTGILNLKVSYSVKVPVPAVSGISVKMEESLMVKGWCGYEKTGWNLQSEETVYVTETGMVYHLDSSCNYLDLSIRSVSAESLDTIRNKNQGIYHACESCGKNPAKDSVYVTDYGDRYHHSLSCSGLKRTVYAIPLSEAVGKGVCTKCGR